jgi:hypothetical protein
MLTRECFRQVFDIQQSILSYFRQKKPVARLLAYVSYGEARIKLLQ